MAGVEAHLIANPDDGKGWAVIAPVYMRLGRYDDAAHAYSEALRLLGEDAMRRAAYGEALFAAAGGVVTADARARPSTRRWPTSRASRRRASISPSPPSRTARRPRRSTTTRSLIADAPAGRPVARHGQGASRRA